MIALYILGGLLLLILIFLVSSVSVKVSVNDDLTVSIGFLLYHKRVYPLDKTKNNVKDKQDSSDGKKNSIRDMIDKNGLTDTIKELTFIAKTALIKLGSAAKHIRVKYFKGAITVATADPCKTAVEYGTVCAVAFPLLNGLQNAVKWNLKKTEFSVLSDFTTEKPRLRLDFKIKLRLIHLLKAALGVLWTVIVRKIKQTIKQQQLTPQIEETKK